MGSANRISYLETNIFKDDVMYYTRMENLVNNESDMLVKIMDQD